MILLADDSVHALRMGEQILRGEGWEVVTASTRGGASAVLAEKTPEILIADISLAGGGGLELCRLAKASAARVILTAGALEELDEAGARAAGCDEILRKPFEASVLLAAVRRLTKDPSGEAALRAAVAKALEAEMPRLIREITEKVRTQLKRN